jgi:hypothetical protein
MVIDMNEEQLKTVAHLRAFLAGTLGVNFQPMDDAQRYRFISVVLKRLGYRRLRRPDKGVVLRYLEQTSGYSRQQLTRLVARAMDGEVLVKHYGSPEKGLVRKFTPAEGCRQLLRRNGESNNRALIRRHCRKRRPRQPNSFPAMTLGNIVRA